MNTSSLWRDARNVLCIRLDNMGDVLMSTPAIRALKHACSGRKITLMASSAGAALGPFLPEVEAVITYNAPWSKNDVSDRVKDEETIRMLRQANFDAAVIFTVYSQSPLPAALMCRLAGIPLALAYCRENPYRLLSDWKYEVEPGNLQRHETQRQLDLVEHIDAVCDDPRLSFVTRDSDRRGLCEKLVARGVSRESTWIVAHCGASAPSRRYPAESYADAMMRLGPRAGHIILTGSDDEKQLTRRISEMCGPSVPIVDLAGELSLGELACLIEDGSLLLSNNTGPVHMAAALGTPIVDLYALTNPQHTPWMVPHRVLFHDVSCKYCYRSICPELHHDCLRKVPPQAVCDAVLELLEDTNRTLLQPIARAV